MLNRLPVKWWLSFGNLLEWYDFSLYAYFSTSMAKEFFPDSTSHPLFWTYLIFATGIVSRALGAIYFGHLGDRLGRVRSLLRSNYIMFIPTGLMGLLPSFNAFGYLSIVLLVVTPVLATEDFNEISS